MKQRIKILALGCIMIVSSWMMVYASTAKLTATSANGVDASCYTNCTYKNYSGVLPDYVTYYAMMKGSERSVITSDNPAKIIVRDEEDEKNVVNKKVYYDHDIHTTQKYFYASYVIVKVTCDDGKASKTLK